MSSKLNGPDLRYSSVLKYLEQLYPGIRKKAFDEFCELVEPTLDKLSGEEKKHLRELSSEWLIFDRCFEGDISGIGLYCKENPDHRGRGFLKSMEESERTAYSGVFWIEEVSPTGARVHLRDSSTGKVFSVYDKTMSSSISSENGGILMTRVVAVEGKYYFPGNPVGYLPIKVSEEMKREALEASDGAEQSFVDIARLAFRRTMKEEDLPTFPKSAEIDASDPKALAEFRADVKRRYISFASEHHIELAWEVLVDKVFREDGKLMPHVMMQQLFGEVAQNLESQDDLAELCCIWSDVWNAYPHEILGSFSPLELSKKADC